MTSPSRMYLLLPLQKVTQGDGCLADSVLQTEGDQRAELAAGAQEAVTVHKVRGRRRARAGTAGT